MNDKIKTIAINGKNEVEMGDAMIKDMCRLTNDLLDYRYVVEHYEANSESSTMLRDRVNVVKKSMVVLMSDMEIYAEQMDITDEVEKLINKRINKIVKRLEG